MPARWGWLRRRPTAAAALVYARAGGGPLRTRARARAHALGVGLPLDRRPLGLAAPGGRPSLRIELRAGRFGRPVPALAAVQPRAPPGCTAVEHPHRSRAPVLRERTVGGAVAVQPARLPAALLVVARVDRGHEGVCRRLRHLPARSRARHALRRRSPVRAGVRVQPLLPGLDLLAADERVGAAAVAAPAHRAGHPQAGAPPRLRPRRRRGPAVLRRPSGVELPPARRHGVSSSPSGRSCCGARECWGPSGVRCSPSPSG